jgi:hypothetical protein
MRTSNTAEMSAQAKSENPQNSATNGQDASTPFSKLGSIAGEKTLYAKFDKNGNRSWSKKTPLELEEAAEDAETRQYAVLVRKSTPPITIIALA